MRSSFPAGRRGDSGYRPIGGPVTQSTRGSLGSMSEPVDVWVVPLDRPEEELRRAYGVLSPEERARAGDPPFPPRKRRYVARQAAVRAILAERTGAAPDRVPIVRSRYGKPALAGMPGVRFSVSDSGDLALVAIARREVGIDVERIRDRPAGRRAAELGIDRFFDRWTRAEASGKALGTGLLGSRCQEELSSASVDVGPGFAATVTVAAERIEVRLRPY
jgi:phosphopantetheinyl transferase